MGHPVKLLFFLLKKSISNETVLLLVRGTLLKKGFFALKLLQIEVKVELNGNPYY